MGDNIRSLRFYYRHDCHLCEDMWAHLQELQQDWRFEVEAINIDADSKLKALHGVRIPVLETAEGVEICNYYLNQKGLIDYLEP
jgi:thiol-disulfide isomerase/thioredoxin